MADCKDPRCIDGRTYVLVGGWMKVTMPCHRCRPDELPDKDDPDYDRKMEQVMNWPGKD